MVSNDQSKTDLIITTSDGVEFKCHSSSLIHQSVFFCDMIREFRSKASETYPIQRVELEEDSEVISILLEFCSGKNVMKYLRGSESSLGRLCKLLKATDKYGMECLKEIVSSFLEDKFLSRIQKVEKIERDDMMRIYLLSWKLGMRELLDVAADQLVRNQSGKEALNNLLELKDFEDFDQLAFSSLFIAMLQYRIAVARSAQETLKAFEANCTCGNFARSDYSILSTCLDFGVEKEKTLRDYLGWSVGTCGHCVWSEGEMADHEDRIRCFKTEIILHHDQA